MATMMFAGVPLEGSGARTLDADLYNADMLGTDMENLSATGNLNIGNVIRYDEHAQRSMNGSAFGDEHQAASALRDLLQGGFLNNPALLDRYLDTGRSGAVGSNIHSSGYASQLQTITPFSRQDGNTAAEDFAANINVETSAGVTSGGGGGLSIAPTSVSVNPPANGGPVITNPPGGSAVTNVTNVTNTTPTNLLEQVTNVAGDTVTNVTNIAGDAVEDVTNIIDNVTNNLTEPVTNIINDIAGDTLEGITNIVDQVVDTVMDTPLGSATEQVTTILNETVTEISNLIEGGDFSLAKVVDIAQGALDDMTGLLGTDNEVINSVVSIATDALDQVSSLLDLGAGEGDNAAGELLATVDTAIAEITEILQDSGGFELLQQTMDMAGETVDQITSLLEGNSDDATGEIVAVVSDALDQVSGLLGEGNIGGALGDTLGQVVDAVQDAGALELVQDITAQVSEVLAGGDVDPAAIVGAIEEAVSGVTESLGGDPLTDAIVETVNGALEQVQAVLDDAAGGDAGAVTEELLAVADGALAEISDALEEHGGSEPIEEIVTIASGAVEDITSAIGSDSGDTSAIVDDALTQVSDILEESSLPASDSLLDGDALAGETIPEVIEQTPIEDVVNTVAPVLGEVADTAVDELLADTPAEEVATTVQAVTEAVTEGNVTEALENTGADEMIVDPVADIVSDILGDSGLPGISGESSEATDEDAILDTDILTGGAALPEEATNVIEDVSETLGADEPLEEVVDDITADIPLPTVEDIPLLPSTLEGAESLVDTTEDTISDVVDSTATMDALLDTSGDTGAVDAGTLFTDVTSILGGSDTSTSSTTSSTDTSTTGTTTTTVAETPPPPPPPIQQTVTSLFGGLFG